MSYQSFCYSLFGFLGKKYRKNKKLGDSLNKAHMEMTPDAYIAWAVTTILIIFVVALFIGMLAYAVFIPLFENAGNQGASPDEQSSMDSGTKMRIFLGIWLGTTLSAIIYFKEIRFGETVIKGNMPMMKANQRGKKADLYLPHAASYVAALAASNATMDTIFYSLSAQKAKKTGIVYYLSKIFGMETERDVFPVISEESAAIYRDSMLLGKDTLTSIQNSVERAPSAWLAEFFQGIYSTISSGGNLKLYFLNSSERFMEDIKQDQKQTLEQLATFAEMFVTVAVAMPIFLIIILIITVWISNSGSSTGNSLSTLYMVIFMLVPLLHFIFAMLTQHSIKKFSI